VLGGTSSINGMIYIRGNPRDYEEWREHGCHGWGWDEVLPYFKKAERQERGASAFHGVEGNLRVSDQRVRSELAEAFVAAGIQAGLVLNDDFNGVAQEGVGNYQTTTYAGRRWSTAEGYLRKVPGRAGLTVQTKVQATRVLIVDGVARGVEVRDSGGIRTVTARREVIVAAGVFNSPKLLQLSGLGPASLLRKMGIPVIRDLPGVGANLQDHLGVRMVYRCPRKITLNDLANSRLRQTFAAMRYIAFRSGPLSANGLYAGAFLRTGRHLDRPDLQINMNAGSMAQRTKSGVRAHPFSAFSMTPVYLRPEGRGTVCLRSPDPSAPPEIRLNLLSSESEYRAMIAGMRFVRHLAKQPALAGLVSEEFAPGAAVRTDEDLANDLRARVAPNLHPVGSCRMGAGVEAVVDPRLKVIGIRGLRVVDASIMPFAISGNTNAAVVMIAEKAADLILNDAGAVNSTE
jgi:choline dehydrogenase